MCQTGHYTWRTKANNTRPRGGCLGDREINFKRIINYIYTITDIWVIYSGEYLLYMFCYLGY